jgi:S-adenosylmethionine synthetase
MTQMTSAWTTRLRSRIVAIDKQSPDIAQGVHLNKSEEEIGLGD